MLDKIKLIVWIVLLSISVAFNVFFIAGNGIKIDKSINTTSHQHQEQFQGQISMNMWMSQGNTVKWTYKVFMPVSAAPDQFKEIKDYITSLPPQYSYFAKWYYIPGVGTVIFTPEFMTEVKK